MGKKWFQLLFLYLVVAVGLDRLHLKVPLSSIEILDSRYFRQLYYQYGDDSEFKRSNDYLVEKEKLPKVNKDILDIKLRHQYGYAELEFSSKNILLGQGYPNKGISDLNYQSVIDDLNHRASGIYKIDSQLFLESEVVSAEVFYDLPLELLNVDVEDVIRALSYVRHRHKETRIYGDKTFLSRSNGFSLNVYDKKNECFKKFLGAKYKKLNLNIEDTLRVEVFGKSDSKSKGLRKKYFFNKRLKDILHRQIQYSIILDFIDELEIVRA